MVIFFSFLIIGLTVLVYIQSSQTIGPGYDAAKCSSFAIFDELLYGDSIKTWMGFQTGIKRLTSYRTSVRNGLNDIQFYFDDTAWIDEDFQSLISMVDQVDTDFTGLQIPLSPNPLLSNVPSDSLYLNTIVMNASFLFIVSSVQLQRPVLLCAASRPKSH
jgi:hypothetical protein